MSTIQRYRLSTVIIAIVFALVGAALLPFTASAETLLMGQRHSYDVRLRGDGSAVVNARISVANDEDTAVKSYAYSSSKGALSDVLAFQQIVCSELPPYVPTAEAENSNAPAPEATETIDINGEDAVRDTAYPECYPKKNSYTRPALERGQDAITYYQPAYTTIYKKVDIKQAGDAFTLTPAVALEPAEEATFIIIYNVADVSSKKLGVYSYDFRTLKTNNRIQSASVAISVDNDYVLEGSADDKTNYRPKSTGSVDLSESLNQGSSLSTSDSSSVSSYVGSIGNNGTIVKTTSSLASGETFNVTGRFATNEFLLHWPRTLLRAALVIILIAALVYLYIRRRRRLQKIKAEQAAATPPETTTYTAQPTEFAETKNDTAVVSAFDPVANPAIPAARAGVINVNLQALPFYEYFHYRRMSYMFFGWLCAIATGIFFGLMLLITFWLQSQSTYGSFDNDALAVIAFICIAAATFLGFILLTLGLPYLYAPTARDFIKIIFHSIGLFILIALFSIIILSVTSDKQPTYDYPYSPYNYGDDYLKAQ